MKKYLYLTFGAGVFSALFHGLGFFESVPWHLVYSDTLGFYDRVAAPGFAYISKLIEYPVLTGLFIQFSGMLGQGRLGYYLASVAGLIALGAVTTYFLYKIIPESRRKLLLPYWIFAPTTLIFLTSNWDIIAVALILAALYFFQKEKPYWGAFFLSLGFSAKFYPILYFLPVLIKKREWKEWLKIISIFLAVFSALNGFFMLYHFDIWNYFYALNASRDPNPDSAWTIIRYFIRPFEVKTINWISLALFAASYFYLMLKNRKEPLVKLFMIATLLFVLFNKIFSPQYLLWLLPFYVLYFTPPKKLFYALEFSNLAAFFAILPWFFLGRDMFYFYLAAPFVVLRHFLLATVLFKVLRAKQYN